MFDDDEIAGFVVGVVITAIIALIIATAVFVNAKSEWQSEAVKNGHAYWKVSDDLGHTKFEWIQNSPAERK